MIRALIADDEPLAREALRDALAATGGVEVVAECANGVEAAEAIRRLRPDVAFLDIDMPELNGLAAAEAATQTQVVFVTAYDDYAVEAFALEAIDYLLKPIDEKRVAEALRRVGTRTQSYEKRFIAGAHGKLIVIGADDIRYLEAAGNYVRLHTTNASPLLRGALSSLEKRLDPNRFVRVHRSFIVNAALIAELRLTSSGDYDVVLRDGGLVPMSRTYRDAVIERIRRSV